MTHTHNVKFDLLANARDSLKRAIDLLVWKDIEPEHARLKHAITNAAHSIELLLKERLRRINPAFIFDDVDKYPSLEARTVTVDIAITRLEKIGDVTLSNPDKNNLRSLRRTRNAIEHYEWHTTEKEAKLLLAMPLVSPFHLPKNISASILAQIISEMILGGHSLTNYTPLLKLMVRG
jgi:hypothetical protein